MARGKYGMTAALQRGKKGIQRKYGITAVTREK